MKDRKLIIGDPASWRGFWLDEFGAPVDFTGAGVSGKIFVFTKEGVIEKSVLDPNDWLWADEGRGAGQWIFTPAETTVVRQAAPIESRLYRDGVGEFMGRATITFVGTLSEGL